MKVSDLRTQPLLAVEPDASLADVARRMRVEDCGSAAVIEGGRLLGILTERDLVGAIADGTDPREATAGFFMSPNPVTVHADDDVAVVAMRMVALGIRHLPVVDAGGAPVAMLSARHLAAALEKPALAGDRNAGE